MTDITALRAALAALADRYRIDRELGAGGMATVYLAQDLKHQRNVAVKVLHPDLAAALGTDRFRPRSRPPPISSTPTSSHSTIPARPRASCST